MPLGRTTRSAAKTTFFPTVDTRALTLLSQAQRVLFVSVPVQYYDTGVLRFRGNGWWVKPCTVPAPGARLHRTLLVSYLRWLQIVVAYAVPSISQLHYSALNWGHPDTI